MNEMRKELGLRKVKKGNLLAFFINDITANEWGDKQCLVRHLPSEVLVKSAVGVVQLF